MREFKKLPLELFIGYDIEQNSRVIELDASEMVEKYPSGILQLVCKRPGEETTYIAPSFEQDGGTLRWTLTSYDVEKAGQGLAIVALVDTSEESVKVLASHKIRTGIEEGLHFRDAESVDPEDSLIARVLAAVSQAQAYAQDAAEALGDVQDEHDQAIADIEAKGQETRASIPQDYTALSGDVSDLKSALAHTALQPSTLETLAYKVGYYDISGFHALSGVVSAEYACTEGSVISVTCSGNSAFAGYYIYDSNDNILVQGTKDVKFTDFVVLIPNGAAKVGLNKLFGSGGSVTSITVKKIDNQQPNLIDDILEDLTDLSSAVNDLTGDVNDLDTAVTSNTKDIKTGADWHELIEVENKNGVYVNTTRWIDNGDGVNRYVTKVYDVTDIVKARFTGYVYNVLGEKANGTIKQIIYNADQSTAYTNYEFDASEYIKIYVGGNFSNFWGHQYAHIDGYIKINSRWENKKIVWFGTSIPAGGYIGANNPVSYPLQIGKLLGATVYNEAVGSSGVHACEVSRITATNPYGFRTNFENASRCMTNTIAMMQWIGNWADYYCNGGTYQNSEPWDDTVFTSMLPVTWSSAKTDEIKQFSYENKLDKYLTDSSFPDLFVFDHGYNDAINQSDHNGTYEDNLSQYGRENPYSFRAGMNFLIDRILAFNPQARIVMVGDYDRQVTSKQYDYIYQQAVADDYEIPLYKLWEMTGWCQVEITAHYTWDNGTLKHTANNTETHTVLGWAFPDETHPHTDKTGKAIRKLTYLLSAFLENL